MCEGRKEEYRIKKMFKFRTWRKLNFKEMAEKISTGKRLRRAKFRK